MNAPIQAIYQSGQHLYAILINPVDGSVYNTVTPGWEAYNSGHWAQYAVTLTEYPSSGYFRGVYPITVPAVLSTDVIYAQNGGSPALGDTLVTGIYQSQGVNVGAVGNAWQSGQNMGLALGAQQVGAIFGTPVSGTILVTNLTNTQTDAYAGAALIMTSGALVQQRCLITAYDGSTFTLTTNGFPSGLIPANNDTFIIV